MVEGATGDMFQQLLRALNETSPEDKKEAISLVEVLLLEQS
ncbi:MAG TPA: hypothetical protein PLD14_03355 [Candidatus Pacearchaeota archaeon]|nr:hypothetical protein [Candidatus Pacearchaeota archaeon]HPR80235.1 hypothetical protein [Candidatus Pacearchaeota archaeon]